MTLLQLQSIDEVRPEHWDELVGTGYPFLRHAFLHALEASGSVSPSNGWTPAHLVLKADDGRLDALMPLYLKMHSYGEYVFDFQWADAWERAGQRYYPKLLAAVPFSPVQGPRLIARKAGGADALLAGIDSLLMDREASGGHVLFNTGGEDHALEKHGWVQRLGCQFHWFNRGYAGFDDFLTACSSRKRKNFRKERAAVAAQGFGFHWVAGEALEKRHWDAFYPFYAATYYKRGQEPYLNRAFFSLLNAGMADAVRLLFVRHEGRDVAGALFLAGNDTLYGRYWGCLEEYDRLHFETCFYQGMELCIAEGLSRFDAGAQGEHKLIRGFEPVLTQSWHKLQPGLHEAVADFLVRERAGIKAYQQDARSYLPYRQE
ncbi:N-acetyltransferase [Halopseudomonas nanhaiensis]|uniref:GNAT family N-acetyltransferase n=1 Tax=Halopseudomonas nanhaiensis TaxID=2830842 RepID=UPI001CBE52F7|nr:GNAT family N-acetyltransferase [Halopseudomonas nanhaiensis]UAW99784.1 N-acetyltransferase [Halopseudomonas nanhaiensis]